MQAIQNVHLRWKCKTRRVSVFHLRWKCKTRRVSVFHLRWKCKTRRVSVLHLRWKCKTRRVSVFHLRWKCKTRRVSVSHLRWKYKTRRVWVSPCRGVLHTPHIYPIRGKRKAFDDQMCKMIFGPKGRLWGVCNTPLLGKMKTQHVSVFHLRWKCRTHRIWMFPCRGVLHTPHIYPIRGKRKTFDDQMCKMIFGPKSRPMGRMQYAPTREYEYAPRFSFPM